MCMADTNSTEKSLSWEALLVKKCTASSGIQSFITVFTKAHHCSWSSDKWNQSTTCHCPLRLILILYPYLYPALSFRLTDQTQVRISNLSNVCHVYYIFNSPWLVHHKVIWWKAKVMVFLSMYQNWGLGAISVLPCSGSKRGYTKATDKGPMDRFPPHPSRCASLLLQSDLVILVTRKLYRSSAQNHFVVTLWGN